MNLRDFHNLHRDQVGWVFGRGANTFDYRRIADIDGPCFFINDAVANEVHMSHGAGYWFALDDGHHGHLPGLRCLPVLHEGGWASAHLPALERALWWRQDPTSWNHWPLDLMAHAGLLFTRLGTICPLLHFAWWVGVRRVKLVGCDGIQVVDMSGLKPGWDDRLPNLSGKTGGCVYGLIRKLQDELMARLGLEAEYVGTPTQPSSQPPLPGQMPERRRQPSPAPAMLVAP